MDIKVDMIQMIGFAVVVFLAGNFIVNEVEFLKKYCIPAAVVGGLLFTLIHLVGHYTGAFSFVFDMSLKNFFMVGFFSTIGFAASLRIVKQGGKAIALLLMCSVIMLVLQNIWGTTVCSAFGLNPLLGMSVGSISLMGGPATSAALAPILEANGANNATTIAIASAVAGIILADLIAGPVAKYLIDKKGLVQKAEESDRAEGAVKVDFSKYQVKTDEQDKISIQDFSKGFFYMMIVMTIGSLVSLLMNKAGMLLPEYIGAIFTAAVVRNLADARKVELPINTINAMGKVFLNIFLTMTIMSLEVWKIAGMAMPLMAVVLGQVILLVLFTIFVVFNLLGKDYDSAVICAGFYGYAIGVVPNSVVSMNAVTEKYGRQSPKAFFTVPIVGGFLIDLVLGVIVIEHMAIILTGGL